MGIDIAVNLYPVKAAVSHLEYELPLYIAIFYSPKTMNKRDLAMAIAADAGMNKTFAYRALCDTAVVGYAGVCGVDLKAGRMD